MLEIIFIICMLCVFGKLFIFGIKAAWGLSKIFFTIIFLPIILIGMVIAGLIYIAFPIVIIIGFVGLNKNKKHIKTACVVLRAIKYHQNHKEVIAWDIR